MIFQLLLPTFCTDFICLGWVGYKILSFFLFQPTANQLKTKPTVKHLELLWLSRRLLDYSLISGGID